jgi:hypothetical protein
MARKNSPTEGGEAQMPAKQPKGFALPPVRGSKEWKAWVERLAEFDRASLPDLVDRALVAYAKQIKFRDAPPRR